MGDIEAKCKRTISVAASYFCPTLFESFKIRRIKRFYAATGITYIHIPKAAGSSISKSLYGTRLGHYSVSKLRENNALQWPYFSVYREPMDRFYSALRYAIQRGGKGGKYYGPSISCSEECVDYVLSTSIDNLDPIFIPQSHYFGLSELNQSLCVGVFTIKNMNKMMEVINEAFDRGYKLETLNSTAKHTTLPKLSGSEIVLIERFYKTDFKNYKLISQESSGFLAGRYLL